jgi:GntR family transcriptional regulator
MYLSLSDVSPLPLREQIVRRIRGLILSGELAPHTQLPSIRGLAKEQRVGIVTVQRAYEDLEREGMIYARQGKGYFVSAIPEASRQSQAVERVRRSLSRPLREARQMGLGEEEIHRIVRSVLTEKEDTP